MAESFMGSRYAAGRSAVGFRVRSMHATRIELWLFPEPTGVAAALTRVMTIESAGVFATNVSAADLAAAGLATTVYYGYRAWGANWQFDAAWTAGSVSGFISDVDADGNRFNPNKLLLDPFALEVSHNPLTPEHG